MVEGLAPDKETVSPWTRAALCIVAAICLIVVFALRAGQRVTDPSIAFIGNYPQIMRTEEGCHEVMPNIMSLKGNRGARDAPDKGQKHCAASQPSDNITSTGKRALVIYTWTSFSDRYALDVEINNFGFFERNALFGPNVRTALFEGVDYLIVQSNLTTSASHNPVVTLCEEKRFRNIRLMITPQGPCDLCTVGRVLKQLGSEVHLPSRYSFIAVVNSGIRGPFFTHPEYTEDANGNQERVVTWIDHLALAKEKQFSGRVVVGSSASMEHVPHLQSFAFGWPASATAPLARFLHGQCGHSTKTQCILGGELLMAAYILSQQFATFARQARENFAISRTARVEAELATREPFTSFLTRRIARTSRADMQRAAAADYGFLAQVQLQVDAEDAPPSPEDADAVMRARNTLSETKGMLVAPSDWFHIHSMLHGETYGSMMELQRKVGSSCQGSTNPTLAPQNLCNTMLVKFGGEVYRSHAVSQIHVHDIQLFTLSQAALDCRWRAAGACNGSSVLLAFFSSLQSCSK